jgi:hypothetical protein
MEKVSDWDTLAPRMCRTQGRLYYFASYPFRLWFSQKAVTSEVWDEAIIMTDHFAYVDGQFALVGEEDTAHVVWMDRRHNKSRINLTGPPVENNDIYYRRRRDSDKEWSKEVWLSKGLMYCYAPTISAEGNNVVVAWAGIQKAGKWHTDMGPNDIYYVTSKDGGQTWTKPSKVTDNAKDGITAGMPQVALLNGTIHLLYVQGAVKSPTEIAPGLTKLGREPWPIYHTTRSFPQ